MGRRSKIVLLAIVTVVACVLAWMILRLPEPRYSGRPISYWVEPSVQIYTETPEAVAAAFAEMDHRAVEWLAHNLDWHASTFNAKLRRLIPTLLDGVPSLMDKPDRREPASLALGRLGSKALSAVPQLERAARTKMEPGALAARTSARAALIQIKCEPLEPYLKRLENTSDNQWGELALTIAHLGTNAMSAITVLIKALDTNQPPGIRALAAQVLGSIRSMPELCIEPLIAAMKSSDTIVRIQALIALASFGREASAARDELIAYLDDSDPGIYFWVRNALKQVDPEAAQKAGVK